MCLLSLNKHWRKMEISKKKDSEGFTISVGQSTLSNGDVVDHPPEFRNVKDILENINDLEVRDDDIWLVSYSKAGTHWAYEILSMLMRGSSVPDSKFKGNLMVDRASGIAYLNNQPSPRILNSHMRPRFLQQKVKDQKKIVHIARNPKSVAVSFFHHTTRLKSYDYHGTFHSYLPAYIEGYHTLYGSWFEFMQEWWDVSKTRDNIYTIFYEDLKKKPEEEISKLATFLGYEYKENLISDVARMTSFEVMKTHQGKDTTALEKEESRLKNKTSGRRFRKGTVDDWKNYFTVQDNEDFDNTYTEQMQEYPDLKAKIKFE